MTCVNDEIAGNSGRSASIQRTLIEKCGEHSQLQRGCRYRRVASDDFEVWPMDFGGGRGNQNQCQGLTLTVTERLTLPVRNEFRGPTAQDQPEAGDDPRLQPGECGQESLEPRREAAANAEVGSVYAQGKAECSGRRVQGVVRNQVGRHAPDPVRLKSIQGDDDVGPTQEAGGHQDSPLLEASGLAFLHAPEGGLDRFQGGNRLIFRVPHDRRLNRGPAIRRISRLAPRARDLVPGHPAECVCPNLRAQDQLPPDLGARQYRTHCPIRGHVGSLLLSSVACPSSARGTAATALPRHPFPLPLLKQDEDDSLRFFR